MTDPVMSRKLSLAVLQWLFIGGCLLMFGGYLGRAQDIEIPEIFTGTAEKRVHVAERFMVAAANPIAVKAGFDTLLDGGNALDAALVTQLVLNLVEPQSSGIGGGAFIVYWDAKNKILHTFDGRETAPEAATEDRFISSDGMVLKRMEAIVGGKSVGVPGLLRVMELAHRAHGQLSWKRLFEPAIKVAADGFLISPRLNGLLANERALRQIEPARSHYYLMDGTAKPVGSILKNTVMAETLNILAHEGAEAFYSGPIAEDIVTAVTTATRNPADMTLQDMAAYRALERTPLCKPYRRWTVCGMPAPTSGGIGVIQTLGLLESFDFPSMTPWSADSVHLFVEAGKLVYADRAVYIADPKVVAVPQAGLVALDYLKARSELIQLNSAISGPSAGQPSRKGAFNYGIGVSPELPSTTHISVVDADGSAVAMTSSIENAFGSRLMVRGFLLNNQLTDFSYAAVAEDRLVANRVEGGKRPRSSMAPTLVFDEDGDLHVVTGSPGGMAIVPLVTKTLIAMLDWDMNPQEATNLPNVLMFGNTVLLEGRGELEGVKSNLEKRGHRVRVSSFPSGVHAIKVRADGLLEGGADPRREGTVMGE